MKRSYPESPTPEEYRLLELLAVVVRRWQLVARTAAGALAIVLLVAWIVPPTYTARTVLVPTPTQEPNAAPLLMAAATLNMPVGGALGLGRRSSPEQLVQTVLTSRSLEDSVAARVAARHGGSRDSLKAITAIVRHRTSVRQDRTTRAVTVEVRAKDGALAAEIASEYPRVINDIVTRIAVDAAAGKQRTLERQLLVARDQLVESERGLLDFQVERGAADVEEQAKRTVEAAAALQRGIIEQELYVARLRRATTADNPLLRSAVAELNDRRAQLHALTTGAHTSEVLLAARELPELRIAMTRRLRDFLKDEQVYTSLTAALAQTQIDLQDYAAVVSVLDPATRPEQPSWPSLPAAIAAALVLGFGVGMAAAFAREYLAGARQETPDSPFFVAWDQLKTDFGRVRLRRRNGQPQPTERT